jgi:putative membrane protein
MSQDELMITTQELASQRTMLASERTRLATERTLVAWVRTGLALTGFGAVVPRLLNNIQPEWLVSIIAIMFVLSGSLTVYYGVSSYRQIAGRLEEDQPGIPWWVVALLAGMIELGAILILILFLIS